MKQFIRFLLCWHEWVVGPVVCHWDMQTRNAVYCRKCHKLRTYSDTTIN